MSEDSIRVAGVLLITVPTIALGGAMLLKAITRREPGYLDNEVRQNLWRAGHAHAGVLVILALVGMLLLDNADLSSGLESAVRYGLVVPPILMPLGFFLSVTSPRAEKPNRLIYLVPAGGTVLAVTTLTRHTTRKVGRAALERGDGNAILNRLKPRRLTHAGVDESVGSGDWGVSPLICVLD